MNSGLKEYIVKNYCNKYDIDEKEIDFLAENDSTLHFNEQNWKEQLLPLVKDTIKRTELEMELFKTDEEEVEKWNNERYSNFVNEEKQKAIEKIINQNEGSITKNKFKPIRELTSMVAKGVANGVVITGEGGIGKTYNVLKQLNSLGLKDNEDYVRLTTYSTPLEFYRQLYEHKDKKVILIDDVQSIWTNKTMVSILKGVLDDIGGKRIAQYSTTSEKKGFVPDKFIVNAGIIIIANNLPLKDRDVKAVISRCHSYDMNLHYNDVIVLLTDIAKNIQIEGVSQQERLEIVSWLDNYCNASYDLSLRTFNRLIELYQHNKKSWKSLAKNFLNNDEDLEIALQVCKEYVSAKEQVKAFIEKSGKSRATFYTLKKKLKAKGVI